jgi:glutamate/tyrosine decarboxylase-like PLP-dependent enzyme
MSESFFSGTQQIEKEALEICAVDILKAEQGSIDGYVASGGTEANLQAIWIYRNYFIAEHAAKHAEIAILCSEDSHYSMDKASNVLNIPIYKAAVNEDDRLLDTTALKELISTMKGEGVKHFIVVANMMTTMFGSVDDPEVYVNQLLAADCSFKLHIDGAYGGFYYPFANPDNPLNFANPHVSSVTLDAHKMAQAPYGTGIFLIRKDLIHYANTKEASYVEGEDFTLIGSRSGANAIAIWMILATHGPFGWAEKIFVLQRRTQWLCDELNRIGIIYYSNPFSNILTIKSEQVPVELARSLGLVPDNHEKPKWFKVVLMDHVSIEKLLPLVNGLA